MTIIKLTHQFSEFEALFNYYPSLHTKSKSRRVTVRERCRILEYQEQTLISHFSVQQSADEEPQVPAESAPLEASTQVRVA